MRDFPFRFLLLEFSASDVMNYPMSLLDSEDQRVYEEYKAGKRSLPNFKRFKIVEQTKISGKYLMKSLMEVCIKHEVNVMFCDNKHNAFLMCNSIFKRLMELFKEGSDEQERRVDF